MEKAKNVTNGKLAFEPNKSSLTKPTTQKQICYHPVGQSLREKIPKNKSEMKDESIQNAGVEAAAKKLK